MSAKASSQVDLARAFSTVTRVLKENQQSLNGADEYNHNHGDNMVKNFEVITRAVRAKKSAAPSEQLAYASQVLAQRSSSGSAQLYAQGLADASERFKGQQAVTPENAMLLVQALMGGHASSEPGAAQQGPSGGLDDLLGGLMGGQPASAQSSSGGMADLLGGLMGGQPAASQSAGGGLDDLLGGLMGGQPGAAPQSAPAQEQPAGGDMLGSLLGALMGGGQAQPAQPSGGQQGGIDLNTLIAAGMAFFQARQQGAAPLQALVQAVMAGSQMQSSAHHAQSGQLVAGTLLNTLGAMLSGAK